MSFVVSAGIFLTLIFKMGLGLTSQNLLLLGGFALISILFYLVVGLRDRWVDPVLLPIVLLVNSLGLIFIYRIVQIGRAHV
jgi:hypothetical protein